MCFKFFYFNLQNIPLTSPTLSLPLPSPCLPFAPVSPSLSSALSNGWHRYGETTCRTMAIETAMKSSAFGFLLAKLHFSALLTRVPSAVSVVWMAVTGSTLAVIWK